MDLSGRTNEWADILRCPLCNGELALGRDWAISSCGAKFPIVDGVLCTVQMGDLGRQAEIFSKAWRAGRSRQPDPANLHRLAALEPSFSGRVLDVGGGTGYLARSRPDLMVMTTDLVIDGLEDLGTRAVVCPIRQLPFKAQAFDWVVALEVLEHLSTSDRTAAIDEVRRVLKPDGLFLVSVPTWPMATFEWLYRAIRHRCRPSLANLRIWDSNHETRFRRGELEHQLVGFELIARHEWCRSLASAGFLIVNPILNRFSLPGVDLSWLDRMIRVDSYSNLVLLSRRQR